VHKPPELVISVLCQEQNKLMAKLVAQQELLDTTSTNLDAADEAVCCHIGTLILLAIKPTYSSTPLNIKVGCSIDFYNTFTKGWTMYTMQKCCCPVHRH
jgi:hypothetical protein